MLNFWAFIVVVLVARVHADIIVYQETPYHAVVDEFRDMEARFGAQISYEGLKARLAVAEPITGCSSIDPPPNVSDAMYATDYGEDWIVLIERYNCSFEKKIRNAQNAGYIGAIVYNVNSSELVPMSAKNSTGINISVVFVDSVDGEQLKLYGIWNYQDSYFIHVTRDNPFNINTHLLLPFAAVIGCCFVLIIIMAVVKCIKDRQRQSRYRLPSSSLNKIPTCKFAKGDPYDTCAICLEDYIEGEKLRVLPCAHGYHCKCIDPWLTKNRRVCPVCKRKVFAHDERPEPDSESDSEVDDTTPLMRAYVVTRSGGTFTQQRENPFQRARRAFTRLAGAEQSLPSATSESEDEHSNHSERPAASSSSSGISPTPSLIDLLHRRVQSHLLETANALSDDSQEFASPFGHLSVNLNADDIINLNIAGHEEIPDEVQVVSQGPNSNPSDFNV